MNLSKYILIFFLLFADSAYAQVQWVKKSFFDASGGLNDGFAATFIADNEAQSLENVVFTNNGNFKTRDGFAKLNSSTIGATVDAVGLKYYQPTSGTKFLVGVFSDNTIRKMDYQSGGGPDGTWDNITGSLTFVNGVNVFASFAIGEDTLIIEDGISTTAPYKWAGSGNAAALGGSPPNCTMVAYHKRHAFCAGNNSNPSTLYFSDLGDIEDWTGGLSGNVPIETNDGSIIRALVPGFDSLYVFKDDSIWRLSGDDKDNFQLQRMISDTGTLSKNGAALFGSDIFFISDQGDFYLYDGSVRLQKLSNKIQGTLDNSNFDRFQYSQVTVFDEDLYASISSIGSSVHDTLMVLDTFGLAWTKFTGFDANALTVADDGNGKDVLIFGDYAGFVYQYPEGTDDAGDAIATNYTTKWYLFPDLSINKTFEKLYIFANQAGDYSITVDVSEDFNLTGASLTMDINGTSSLWDSATYDVDSYGDQNLIVGELEPNLEGKFFRIKFYNSGVDEPIEIKGWEIYLDLSDRI